MSSLFTRARRAAAIGAMALITLTGCVTNHEGDHPDGWEKLTIEPVPALAEQVTEELAPGGLLIAGSNPPFAPNEYKASNGEIIGFDVDIITALAEVLGVQAQMREAEFTMILPAVDAGTMQVGASGFTDNEERRASFDFVDYLSAGIQWASRPDEPVDPDNACGLTVAVQRGTVSDSDDIPAKSEACVAAGQPPISTLRYDDTDQAVIAVILGRADAFSADSPISAFAVERSEGRLELVGPIYDSAFYGIAVKKDSPLGPLLTQAFQHLVDTGDYARICEMWGIEGDALLDRAMFNSEPFPTS